MYKQLRSRWLRGYTAWQRSYVEWYPKAPVSRSFDAFAMDNPTQLLRPLNCFLTPLAVPDVISKPGDLLHWLGCIGYSLIKSEIT